MDYLIDDILQFSINIIGLPRWDLPIPEVFSPFRWNITNILINKYATKCDLIKHIAWMGDWLGSLISGYMPQLCGLSIYGNRTNFWSPLDEKLQT